MMVQQLKHCLKARIQSTYAATSLTLVLGHTSRSCVTNEKSAAQSRRHHQLLLLFVTCNLKLNLFVYKCPLKAYGRRKGEGEGGSVYCSRLTQSEKKPAYFVVFVG